MGRGRASTDPAVGGRYTAVRAALIGALLGVLALLAAGCGAESHSNEPRPNVATRISVTVSDKAVIVDPRAVGIGPEPTQQIPQNEGQPQPPIDTDAPLDVVFVAANQTDTDSELLVRGPASASSGAMFAGSPVSFQADLPAGTYVITAADIPTARPGRLVVGDFRASSENDVLLP